MCTGSDLGRGHSSLRHSSPSLTKVPLRYYFMTSIFDQRMLKFFNGASGMNLYTNFEGERAPKNEKETLNFAQIVPKRAQKRHF